MSDNEEPTKKTKRPCSEKQLSSLKKGLEALKARREVIAKDRDDYAKKQATGEIPPDAPPPPLPTPKPKIKKVAAVKPEAPLVIQERKIPTKRTQQMSEDLKTELASLKADISALKKPAEIKIEEKIIEKPVEVFRERVVSGSELLNRVFGFKD